MPRPNRGVDRREAWPGRLHPASISSLRSAGATRGGGVRRHLGPGGAQADPRPGAGHHSGDGDNIGHYLFPAGDFHPIGLVLHTGKPLAMLDPYTGEATEMSLQRIERILRQRFGLIMACQDAERYGILIGEKPGQMRRTLALRMKRMLERHGKKGYLLALEHVGPELIDFYPVDAFVNTACPRIAIDDAVKYAKPLITPFELEVTLGEKDWGEGYRFDEIP
ncbi:MAG: hypothetical protein CM15mP128_0540 [Methanobacteriota archaeon]|nr:MAG: hypothetical protein CM15mP128_0540 [Euryarchaeota archaeon]